MLINDELRDSILFLSGIPLLSLSRTKRRNEDKTNRVSNLLQLNFSTKFKSEFPATMINNDVTSLHFDARLLPLLHKLSRELY